MLRGTYGLMKVDAYELVGSRLRPLWKYCNANAPAKYWGQGAHFTQCADVDGDGATKWPSARWSSTIRVCRCGAPARDIPTACSSATSIPIIPAWKCTTTSKHATQTGGMILVDAATGETLWELQTPTSHVHGGLCADLDPAAPGLECFGVDKKAIDGKEQIVGSWLKTAAGEPLETPTDWRFGRPTIYWDADLQKELIFGRVGSKVPGRQGRQPNTSFRSIDVGRSRWSLVLGRQNGLQQVCTGVVDSGLPLCARRSARRLA